LDFIAGLVLIAGLDFAALGADFGLDLTAAFGAGFDFDLICLAAAFFAAGLTDFFGALAADFDFTLLLATGLALAWVFLLICKRFERIGFDGFPLI
jgi:hypothetical protein